MPKPAKAYPIRLAGTRSYMAAIAAIDVGDVVELLREIGNPHDPDALAIATSDGATIGYIARDSWLRRALVEERRGCRATVEAIEDGAGVTIAVVLTDEGPIGERGFAAAD